MLAAYSYMAAAGGLFVLITQSGAESFLVSKEDDRAFFWVAVVAASLTWPLTAWIILRNKP